MIEVLFLLYLDVEMILIYRYQSKIFSRETNEEQVRILVEQEFLPNTKWILNKKILRYKGNVLEYFEQFDIKLTIFLLNMKIKKINLVDIFWLENQKQNF